MKQKIQPWRKPMKTKVGSSKETSTEAQEEKREGIKMKSDGKRILLQMLQT